MDYREMDDIVCIEEHPEKACIKDNSYVALKIRTSKLCGCKEDEVDIGIIDPNPVSKTPTYRCRDCKQIIPNDGIWWLRANRFRGLDSLVNIDQLTEIIKEPLTV